MRKVCTIFTAIILIIFANLHLSAQEKPGKVTPTYFDYNEAGASKALAGEYAAARPLFSKSIELNPNCVKCRYNLAWVLSHLELHNEVIRELEITLKLEPGYAKALALIGDSYIKLQRYSESLPYLEKAMDVSSAEPNADVYLSYGHALIKLDRIEEALEYFEKSVKLQPNKFETHNNLGYALYLLGRTSEAFESLKTALSLNPRAAAIHNNIGMIYEKFGKEGKAFECYTTAVELNPNHVESRFNLGLAQLRRGNRQAVYNELSKLEKLDTAMALKLRDALQGKFVIKVSENR